MDLQEFKLWDHENVKDVILVMRKFKILFLSLHEPFSFSFTWHTEEYHKDLLILLQIWRKTSKINMETGRMIEREAPIFIVLIKEICIEFSIYIELSLIVQLESIFSNCFCWGGLHLINQPADLAPDSA